MKEVGAAVEKALALVGQAAEVGVEDGRGDERGQRGRWSHGEGLAQVPQHSANRNPLLPVKSSAKEQQTIQGLQS
jgi:hypothetical protein